MLRRAPLKSYARLQRRTPLRPRSRTNSRQPAESSYLRWIRTLPCAICGGLYGPSQAAHTKVLGPAGMATKSPNRSVIPLCQHDHIDSVDSYHRIQPELRWADYHNLDLPALVARLNQCYELARSYRRAA